MFTIKVRHIPTDQIRAKKRHRRTTTQEVDNVCESIKQVGLISPIRVRDEGDGYILVCGNTRLQAFRRLEQDIPAFVYTDKTSDLEIELVEIDENLIRGGLSKAEEAQHIARRAEILERTSDAPVKTLSAITGSSTRTVRRKRERATKVAPETLEAIKGTEMDTGVGLDAMGSLTHAEQKKVVGQFKKGATFTEAYKKMKGVEPKAEVSARWRGRASKVVTECPTKADLKWFKKYVQGA